MREVSWRKPLRRKPVIWFNDSDKSERTHLAFEAARLVHITEAQRLGRVIGIS
jgi:hypothetical protein